MSVLRRKSEVKDTDNTIDTRMPAATAIPATPIVERAIEFARQKCEPYLFNHVMRSWLFAEQIGQLQGIEHDPEVVALATLLHDLTLNESFAGPRRFEVEAADLARSFALEMGFDERRAQLIWDSVALNSTPSIGLYKELEVALCTAGICLDVIGLQHSMISSDAIMKIVDEFPRLGMKTRMTQCFCHIAKMRPETTYNNFVRDFGERFVPSYRAPSVVDLLMNAPFKE
jgi:hypothetical protein